MAIQGEPLRRGAVAGSVAAITVAVASVLLLGPWSLAVVGLLLAGAALVTIALRPWLGFMAYVVLLAPHVLLMSLLYGVVGLPAGLVRAVSAWKEALLLLLLFGAMVRITLRTRHVVTLPDMIMTVYVLWVLFVSLLTMVRGIGVVSLLYGLRDALLPVLAYVVGRTLLLNEARARWVLRVLLVVGLVLAAIGIIERQFIPTELHVRAGIPLYYREILGFQTFDYLLGLPANYWTSANSGLLRRAVSVYGSSQPFALSFLLFLPVAGYLALRRDLPERRLALVALVVMLVGLALTITRFTIVICLAQLLLIGLLLSRRARRLAVGILAVAVVGMLITVLFVPPVRVLVVNTITFQDHSSAERLRIWGATLQLIVSNPAGYGLAITGQTATRFGGTIINIEGQYSKIGVEQGLIGLLFYIGILAVASMYLLRGAARSQSPYLAALSVALAVAIVGVAVNSMTTEWHNSIALVYPMMWILGACVATLAREALERRRR